MAWTGKGREKVESPGERQCAEPVHQKDQHQATRSAAAGRADLPPGDVLAVESPVAELIVSPEVVEVAPSGVPEAVVDLNVLTVVGPSELPVAEEHCAVLVVVGRCASPAEQNAFPEVDQSEGLEAAAAPCSVVDRSEYSVVMVLNAEGVQ